MDLKKEKEQRQEILLFPVLHSGFYCRQGNSKQRCEWVFCCLLSAAGSQWFEACNPKKNLLPPFPPIFLSCFDLFAAALTVCCEVVVDSVCLLLLLLLYHSGGGLQQHLKAFYLLFPSP